MAPGVAKSYIKHFYHNLAKAISLLENIDGEKIATIIKNKLVLKPTLDNNNEFNEAIKVELLNNNIENLDKIIEFSNKNAYQETDKETYQAMEAFIHNLNTMHSRAGAQVPFSSINYGMDTSSEGRMVMKNILLATDAGLGHGETPIFPIQIFRVKEGINYNEGEPNYDLFKLACKTSAKRLFPNFSFVDAPFNLKYYKGTPETEIAYMGCRTRVMANIYDKNNEISFSRGNLSFTTINLPRLAILSNGDVKEFFNKLDDMLELCIEQLLERFEIQCRRKVKNYPFLMEQGIWLGSDKLKPDDEVREVLKHGTLTVGHMAKAMDKTSKKYNLNFSLIATPAEGLSGRFIKMDKKLFGNLEGITDREYYTNSFHIPVYYPISAYNKIKLEGPYHALTNGGHISYIEMDGDPTKNLSAFEKIIRAMHDNGIGYGAINHPVDRDPICGYNGIIDDVCPCCGRKENEHHGFERISRINLESE